jgi:hypothetical protein
MLRTVAGVRPRWGLGVVLSRFESVKANKVSPGELLVRDGKIWEVSAVAFRRIALCVSVVLLVLRGRSRQRRR